MNTLKGVTSSALATLLVIGFLGCGQETAYVADSTRPVVTATTPTNGATSVAYGASLTATFSKPMNSSTINTTTFTLNGPGPIALSGTVSYSGLTATFVPSASLAANTTYVATITSGAQDTASPANSLLANYVWSFTTSPAPLPPTVLSTVPANNATGVLLTQSVSATFSKPMNAATLTTATFMVTGTNGTVVPGTVTYTAATNTATFTPAGNLLSSTTYEASVTTGAQDTTGLSLVSSYAWVFRTVPAPTLPTVISTNPANKAAATPVNQQVAATFSSAMNPATINSSTFTLTAPGNIAVAGTVTYAASGSIATFDPTAVLAASTTYVATITTGAQDLSGNALAANYVWTFTTAAAPDTIRPTVIATNPVNAATGVSFNQAVTATFSKAMNAATISVSTFTMAGPGVTPVTGAVTYAGISDTATFTPLVNLLPATVYTATITTGVTDLSGNTLLVNYVWAFTTGAAADITKPRIILTNPLNAATGVVLTQAVSASFSEAMNPLTLTTATFGLTTGGAAVAGTVSYDSINYIATFTPSTSLLPAPLT